MPICQPSASAVYSAFSTCSNRIPQCGLLPKEALFFVHFRGSEAQGIWGDVEGIERGGYGDGVGCRYQPGCRSQEGPTLADDGGGGKKPSWVWTLVMARTFSLIGLADVHS